MLTWVGVSSLGMSEGVQIENNPATHLEPFSLAYWIHVKSWSGQLVSCSGADGLCLPVHKWFNPLVLQLFVKSSLVK